MIDPILCEHHADVLRNAARQHDHDPDWLVDAASRYSRSCCKAKAARDAAQPKPVQREGRQ